MTKKLSILIFFVLSFAVLSGCSKKEENSLLQIVDVIDKPVDITYDPSLSMNIGYYSLSSDKPAEYSEKHEALEEDIIPEVTEPVSDNEIKEGYLDPSEHVIYKPVYLSISKPKKSEVKTSNGSGDFTASDLSLMSDEDIIEKMGPIFTKEQEESGILASVSLAQFILESGYSKKELALSSNNMFGMHTNLSENTWSGSTWDNESIYTKDSLEMSGLGGFELISSTYRAYPDVMASVKDHTAYLLGAYNGDFLRYVGLKGCTDYKSAAAIIKNGGYSTDPLYVDKLCNLIEDKNLTRFDLPADV